ncbi:MAG TPA: hypothetical protein VH679_09295 [Vicinamibacterales bacterium]
MFRSPTFASAARQARSRCLAASGERERAGTRYTDVENALEGRAAASTFRADAAALIHIGLGQRDRVFEALRKACDERTVLSLSLAVEPCFDALREVPRFADLLRRPNVRD